MRHAKSLRDVARSLRGFPIRGASGVESWISHTPKQPEACIFCGGGPLTREHIWPQWSHRYIQKGKTKWYSLRGVEREDRTDIQLIKRPGDPHDFQVACVDERCNNGWMRNLENSVRPIIIKLFGSKESFRLGKKDQITIAKWVALKVIVSGYQPYTPRAVHHTQRKQLAKRPHTLSAKAWQIWIARYDGREAPNLWAAHPFLVLSDRQLAHVRKTRKKVNAGAKANGQTTTYVIGKLFIHVLYSPHERRIWRWKFPPPLSGKLLRIWPPTDFSIVWPPDNLSDYEARLASDAFLAWLKIAARHRRQL